MGNPDDFIIENGVLKKYVGPGGDVVVPDGVQKLKGMTYNDADVSSAFFGRDDIQSIVLPEGLSCIGDCAFYGCSGLERVTIPDTVSEIGYNAFWGTKWLEAQKSEFVYVGNILVRYNGSAARIHIPDGTKALADSLFSDNTTVKEVVLPEGVTSLPLNCFAGCGHLESVCLPSSLQIICEGCFADCKKLRKIEIPDSVVEIGFQAFHGCTSIEEIIAPESVRTIGAEAFRRCSKANRIVILGNTELGKDTLKQTTAPLVAVKLPVNMIRGNQLKTQAVLGYLSFSEEYQYSNEAIRSIEQFVSKSLGKLVPEMQKNPVVVRLLLKKKMATVEKLLDLFADNAEMRAAILQMANEE